MAASTASTSLTAGERYVLDQARKLAATANTDDLRQLAGDTPDSDGDAVRARALGTAKYLLAELAAIVERLDGQ